MTIDLDLVQTSKPEKVAANTFQAYQASVSDAWDIEVSHRYRCSEFLSGGIMVRDQLVEMVEMEVEVVVDVSI